MSINRILADLGKAVDSSSTGDFLNKEASGAEFNPVQWSDINSAPTILDSALASAIVDSAYVQARQTGVGSGGLDSATAIALIDSDYVGARASTGGSGFTKYQYTATANQTTFQDSDANGNVLSYDADYILVHYNGVLLPSADYTATDGSSVVLGTGADSGSIIGIAKWGAAAGSSSAAVWYGDRGVWMGGDGASYTNIIDYIDITTPGNATDFGDLSENKRKVASFSNGTKGVSAGGQLTSYENTNVIEYITFSTTGNATDFGDLNTAVHAASGSSDGTTGLMSGGKLGSSGSYGKLNVIQSVTIDTAANASDFGDLTFAQASPAGCNDATYSITMGGEADPKNAIEYVTIATAGNSADFGDLITGRGYSQGLSDTTRGLIAGGYETAYLNSIEYITIASSSNASDFGDLVGTASSFGSTGCSNATTGVFGGFYRTVTTNIMESIVIQTTGNASDFGDLTVARSFTAGAAGSPS